MSYVLLLDLLERHTLAAVQSAMLARMLGSTVEIPDWFELREQFDETLAAQPVQTDPKKHAMLVAIGLR